MRLNFLKYFFVALFLGFLFLLEISLLPHLSIRGGNLSLLLPVIFLFCFLSKNKNRLAIFTGFFAGFLLDMISFLPLPIFTLLFGSISLIIQRANFIFQSSSMVSFLAVFISIFCIFNLPIFFLSFNWSIFIASFASNLILTIGLFLVFKAFKKEFLR